MRTLLANGRLASGKPTDLLIESGTIAAIGDPGAFQTAEAARRDVGGALIAPAFVDGHIHLDKTFLGCPLIPHVPGGSVRERIEAELAVRRSLDVPVTARAEALIRQIVAFGTTRVRSHVDIDPVLGLANLEAVLSVREAFRDLIDVEIVAFPQSGITSAPGAAELLDEALSNGADLIGGLDPAGIDGDVEGHLDVVFGLAERHGKGVDIHLHDPGPLGCFELRQIAARTRRAGLEGRVAVSHAFALGDVGPEEFGRTAEALAAAGVRIMTSSPAPVPVPPIKRLNAAGVIVFAGSDNIRDAWSPYGNGDMLERAAIIGQRQELVTNEDLRFAFDLVTRVTAGIVGVTNHAVAAGAVADLVAIEAASIEEAVIGCAKRLLVMKGGVVVAEQGRLVAG
jgi:cytosine/creatinine deaminase